MCTPWSRGDCRILSIHRRSASRARRKYGWRDIDLERAIWTIRETKNGEPHDVMLPQQAVELLNYRKGLDKVFVFPSRLPGQHVAQKALGLAQYTARHADPDSGTKDPIEVPWTTWTP
jgi:hypothetical protein